MQVRSKNSIWLRTCQLFADNRNLFSRVNFSRIVKIVLSKLSAAILFIYLCHIVFMYVYFHEGWLWSCQYLCSGAQCRYRCNLAKRKKVLRLFVPSAMAAEWRLI